MITDQITSINRDSKQQAVKYDLNYWLQFCFSFVLFSCFPKGKAEAHWRIWPFKHIDFQFITAFNVKFETILSSCLGNVSIFTVLSLRKKQICTESWSSKTMSKIFLIYYITFICIHVLCINFYYAENQKSVRNKPEKKFSQLNSYKGKSVQFVFQNVSPSNCLIEQKSLTLVAKKMN